MAKGNSKSNSKPSAKAKPSAVVVAEKKAAKVVTTKPKGPVPNYARKPEVKANFENKFSSLSEIKLAPGYYALSNEKQKIMVRVAMGNKGLFAEVLASNCSVSEGLLLDLYLAQNVKPENFVPNYKLPVPTQDELITLQDILSKSLGRQNLLSAQLRRQEDDRAFRAQSNLAQDAFASISKWEAMHRIGTTSKSVSGLIHGVQGVYSLSDKNGKFAVIAVEVMNPTAHVQFHQKMAKLMWCEEGCELHMKVGQGDFVKIQTLNKENLGEPYGPSAEQMKRAKFLHTFIRTAGLAAGLRPRSQQKSMHGHSGYLRSGIVSHVQ